MVKVYKRKRNKIKGLDIHTETIIYINIQKSNIIITITDSHGKIIDWFSSGCLGLRGFRKHTPFAAKSLAFMLYEKTKTFAKKQFILKVKGHNAVKNVLLKYISYQNLNVIDLKDITSLPLNGCKPQKRRKL